MIKNKLPRKQKKAFIKVKGRAAYRNVRILNYILGKKTFKP